MAVDLKLKKNMPLSPVEERSEASSCSSSSVEAPKDIEQEARQHDVAAARMSLIVTAILTAQALLVTIEMASVQMGFINHIFLWLGTPIILLGVVSLAPACGDHAPLIQHIQTISLACLLGIALIVRAYDDDQDDYPVRSLPAAAFLPAVLAAACQREVSWPAVLASWAVVAICLIVSVEPYNAHHLLSLLSALSVSGFVLYGLWVHRGQAQRAMTRLAQLEKENLAMDAELRGDALKHLIGNVAHDLKTPLASFVTGIDLIADITATALHKLSKDGNDSDTSDLQSSLQSINTVLTNNRSLTAFMTMVINRCMDYTKATRGLKLIPKYETIDLYESLLLPFKCFKDVQDKVTISLEPFLPKVCSHVITDKQWLQENVMCLLSNAIKYSEGGLVKARVLLVGAADLPTACAASSKTEGFSSPPAPPAAKAKCSSEEVPFLEHYGFYDPEAIVHAADHTSYLLIEVEDSGIGMTDQGLQELFSPFKQMQRMAGGTGLGLFSLSKRIEALGGRYGVRRRSDLMQGSLFWFAIPYRPDEQSAEQQMSDARFKEMMVRTLASPLSDSTISCSSATIDQSVTPAGGLRVLIVDDSPSIQKMMGMMLRRAGHTVSLANNGVQAVKLLADTAFDIVLMDLQMPVMDGLEAMRRVRRAEIGHHQMMVGVSANSDAETIEEALSAGADAFIAKPFNVDGFHAVYKKLYARTLSLDTF